MAAAMGRGGRAEAAGMHANWERRKTGDEAAGAVRPDVDQEHGAAGNQGQLDVGFRGRDELRARALCRRVRLSESRVLGHPSPRRQALLHATRRRRRRRRAAATLVPYAAYAPRSTAAGACMNTAQHRARLSLFLLARSFLLLAAQRVFRGFRPPSGGVFQCKNARARARGDAHLPEIF